MRPAERGRTQPKIQKDDTDLGFQQHPFNYRAGSQATHFGIRAGARAGAGSIFLN